MPFTIFHLGPMFLFLTIIHLLKPQIKFWRENIIPIISLCLGTVIPDLQGFYSLFIDRKIPLHGFSHTLIGSIIYSFGFAAILGGIIYIITNYNLLELKKELTNFKQFKIKNLLLNSFFWCFIGITIFHLLPDMVMHSDIAIFWPISDIRFAEPYYDGTPTDLSVLINVTFLFIQMTVLGFFLLVFNLFIQYFKKLRFESMD